jgi:AraC-like DNA-binding protein
MGDDDRFVWRAKMTLARIITPMENDIDAPVQSLLGIAALAAELAAQGASVGGLFAHTGVHAWQLEDPLARISLRQRLAIYRNARKLAKRPDIGLLAGARQRISDYGIFGFAMLSGPTFGKALEFSLENIRMAGPVVMQISFEVGNNTAVLRSHGVESLGDLLPFAAEFWRSSMTTLFSRVLEAPFPSKRMAFTYPAPAHRRNYERMFNCPVDFGADAMEWHFDADVLERPCPNANPITAKVCQQFCDRIMAEHTEEADLPRQIRTACINSAPQFPPAQAIANRLGLSLRTLHRRLAESGHSYRSVLDGMRRRVAIELLENTNLLIDQVAERVGFADATSFRKAFVKWTGHPPTYYRNRAFPPSHDGVNKNPL